MTSKLITEASKLTAAIAKIGKDSHALDSSIQIALASATFFAVKDGNIQPINNLFTTASKGVRRAAMQAWLLDHAPVLLNKDDQAKDAPFVFSRDLIATLVQTDKPTAEQAEVHANAVMEVSWTAYKPEVLVPDSFDVAALLGQALKRAKGLTDKGSKPKGADLLTKVQALLSAHSANDEPAIAGLTP